MARMDITERLDRIGRGEHLDLADIVCRDAKAEIERLREYVASSASAGCATAKALLRSEGT